MEFLRSTYHEEINSEGDVVIVGSAFQRSRILVELEPETYRITFEEWLDKRKQDMLSRADGILSLYDNANRFAALKQAYKGNGVVPFIGAGLSMPSGYPGWTSFLWDLQKESHVLQDALDRHLNAGDYDKAAQLLHDDLGSALFNKQLQECFGRSSDALGTINLLPHVFPSANIVTTNFDRLIESVYIERAQGFDTVVTGNVLGECLRLLTSGSRLLVKMHGTSEIVANRVLLQSEYDVAYADLGIVKRFFTKFLFAKSMLFLGCSLVIDRTMRTMEEVVGAEGAESLPHHYAFLELKESDDRVARKKLLAKANIFPIWYPDSEHDESIEALLMALLED